MPKVKQPLRPDEYPDRFLDCQEALMPGFLFLLESAVASGWTENEAIAALIELADGRWLSIGENVDLHRVLASVKRRSCDHTGQMAEVEHERDFRRGAAASVGWQ